MKLKLEALEYQNRAIQSVVQIFIVTARNTFDNAKVGNIRNSVYRVPMENNLQKIFWLYNSVTV